MSFGKFNKASVPLEVVNIANSVWETFLGNYFFGQTDPMTFGNGYNAWGALINPPDSGVDMFWNVYTFSNFSSRPFTAEVWLNSTTPGRGKLSGNVASANQSIKPPPQPKTPCTRAHNSDSVKGYIKQPPLHRQLREIRVLNRLE